MKRALIIFAVLVFSAILPAYSEEDRTAVYAEIQKRHDEAVQRLRQWVKQPSIAAESRGMNEGCELMMRTASGAGFQKVERIDTDGQPGVFATLDEGAARTVGLYFMYDVKQVDPSEWSSPPWDAAIVDKPGFGMVLVGRGAVNQKGPEAAMLAARFMPSMESVESFPSILFLLPKGKKRSDHRIFRRLSAGLKSARRSKTAWAYSCPAQSRIPMVH